MHVTEVAAAANLATGSLPGTCAPRSDSEAPGWLYRCGHDTRLHHKRRITLLGVLHAGGKAILVPWAHRRWDDDGLGRCIAMHVTEASRQHAPSRTRVQTPPMQA